MKLRSKAVPGWLFLVCTSFGLAQNADDYQHHQRGTPQHRPPSSYLPEAQEHGDHIRQRTGGHLCSRGTSLAAYARRRGCSFRAPRHAMWNSHCATDIDLRFGRKPGLREAQRKSISSFQTFLRHPTASRRCFST